MKNKHNVLKTLHYFMYGKPATHEDIVWLYYHLICKGK